MAIRILLIVGLVVAGMGGCDQHPAYYRAEPETMNQPTSPTIHLSRPPGHPTAGGPLACRGRSVCQDRIRATWWQPEPTGTGEKKGYRNRENPGPENTVGQIPDRHPTGFL